VPAVDSGVQNVEGSSGCTLLDDIWAREPFRGHAAFVEHVDRITRAYVRPGDLREPDRDHLRRRRLRLPAADTGHPARKQVHGVFYDNGFRVAANPHIPVFQVREGHTQLNHSYTHPHFNQLSDTAVLDEVLRTEELFRRIGAPLPFKGFRPPFFEADARVQALISGLGYTLSLGAVQTARTGTEIAAAILEQLEPGSQILLHDGPNDTPAGAGSVEALGLIIDAARESGFCFGVTDHTGEVVASRYVASEREIPEIVNPVPYNRLVRPGTPPPPFVFAESPIAIEATHSPATFTAGSVGNTLTVTVSNTSDAPTDDSTVTVTDRIPAGLTATSVAGNGWACAGTTTVRCTRAGVLAPGASYPPITINVDAAADAVSTTNAPSVAGHGGVWQAQASDPIPIR
jgi:uncharacterized repeat protein (TIGR01451 family)